ncbi:La ribonucleoprotein [Cladobotryum mycophilum]|uniref:La ribonucleoprotein n=1 Tax=Cladobotryum mycophilum TaxID=491253 RepID=A0ABR0T1A9_9HYPO
MSEVEAATKPTEATPPVEDKAVEQTEEQVDVPEPKDAEKTEEGKDEGEKEPETKADPKVLKTTASIDYKDFRNNRKFDPSVREVTDDPDAIRKQVEFYFGDWNYPQDKFMWESCGGAENKPIAIEKLHSFKRMRSFQPYSAVVAALRDSQTLDVSGEEGKEVVKRKVAYKPMATSKAKAEAATVYVKGFGDEKPDTQFDLESFFAQFGDIKGIKLRRTNENLFKGSVFVTFTDEETAKKFVELDPAPKWKENDLKIMSKHDYCEEKSELIRQGKLEPNGTSQKKFFEGKDFKGSRGRDRGDKEQGDADDWKKRRDRDQKNGFQDRRGGGRGRGNRGRGGRGGRGGGRDFNRDRGSRQESRKDAAHSESQSNGKRGREEDGGAEAPAAKKVDNKEE